MTSGGIRVERSGDRAILTLDNPPSNALTPVLRHALLTAISDAQDCSLILLKGAGPGFSSALPLEADGAGPSLAELCLAIETSARPVVAILHGLVMGPGAELALAARARIAAPGTRLALPQVALGLCPEGGTTRRLPQLIGAEVALDLLLTGRVVGLDEGLDIGLFSSWRDETDVDIDVLPAAAATPPDPVEWTRAVARARLGQTGAGPAISRIIDCVEAALLLPPSATQAYETVARNDLEGAPESQGLRASARAERRAATLPQRLNPAQQVARLGLAGDRPALSVIAALALRAGIAVLWAAPTDAGRSAIVATLDRMAPTRRSIAERHAMLSRLELVDSLPEGLDLLVRTATASAPPATAELVLDGPAGSLGLSVAPSGRACELALPAEDGAPGVAAAVATLRRIGLPPVLVGGRPVLGARVMQAGAAALARLVALGVPQQDLAHALGQFGVMMAAPERRSSAPVRDMGDEEIRRRWLAAMANEGLRLVEAGIARRPSDIDHALVAGHSFPRWQGGPMYQADRLGLLVVRHDLRRWAGEDAIWQPAPLLDRLIGRGLRLSALDG